MDEIEFPGWRIKYDRPATVAAYDRISIGGPDACGCAACRNWAAIRREVIPTNFQSLLDQLGIPPDREIEVYHTDDSLQDCIPTALGIISSVTFR